MAGRYLGIDFGERRIGLAISDERHRFALPLTTFARVDDASAIGEIEALARRDGVTLLVVGEPVGPEGAAGSAVSRVRSFADKLAAKTGLEVELVPEALTSVEAGRRMRHAGARRSPGRLDAVAAQILLQDALDRRRERA